MGTLAARTIRQPIFLGGLLLRVTALSVALMLFPLLPGNAPDAGSGPLENLLLEAVAGLRPASNGVAAATFWIVLFFADLALLLIFLRIFSHRARATLIHYWLSPLAIFLIYVAAAPDIVAVAALTGGLFFLQRTRIRNAGFMIGFSIACHALALVTLPFIFLYLHNNRRLRPLVRSFFIPLTTVIAVAAMLLLIPGALPKSLATLQAVTPLFLRVPLGANTELVIFPILYLLLLYRMWRWQRTNFFMFHSLLGASYILLLACTRAPPSWYLWTVPFLFSFALQPGTQRSAKYVIVLFGLTVIAKSLGLSRLSPVLEETISSILIALEVALAWSISQRPFRDSDFVRISRRPLSLGIAGDSGTGKDTLAGALGGMFGEASTIMVSGDDYHLYERQAPNWRLFTHLNPHANDLAAFTRDCLALAMRRPILCRHYDHKTGRFSPRQNVESNDVILVSGLHALYPPSLRHRFDISVFLDMDEGVRTFFKVRRDVFQRGHALQTVLASIERRKPDYECFIAVQRQHADIIFSLVPENPGTLDPASSGTPRLALQMRARYAGWAENLARMLRSFADIEVAVSQPPPGYEADITIMAAGVSSEDVRAIALSTIGDLREMLAIEPIWLEGASGVMQLVILYRLIEKSRSESRG
jgi:uridine kinase